MNLLELVQRVAFRSRTVPGQNQPAVVTGLSGRLAHCLDWTQQAWREIQTHRPNWNWMRRDFEGAALAGQRYRSAEDFGLTRWGSWVIDSRPRRDSGWSMYRTIDGPAEEGALIFLPWEAYRRLYLRQDYEVDQPQVFSVDPRGRVAFSPVPDADYTVRGEYVLSPQTLTEPGDTPEMPAMFHDLIVLRALVLLNESDEGAYLDPLWRNRAQTMMAELEASQLPAMPNAFDFGAPLA